MSALPPTSTPPPASAPPMGALPPTAKEDVDFASTRISDQVRTIAFGILAFAWLFIGGDLKGLVLREPPNRDEVLWAAGLSVVTLLVDYAQYVFSYILSARAVKRPSGSSSTNSTPKPTYNYKSALHLARRFAFWVKQLTVLCAVGVLLHAVACAVA